MSTQTSTKQELQSHLKTYKMQLTTLSPVFIGGGDGLTLNKTQYIFDEGAKKIYILDEQKFSAFLTQTKLFEEYMDYAIRYAQKQKSRKGQRPPKYEGGLQDWLKSKNVLPARYPSLSKYSVEAGGVERGNDLHGFIKNADLMPYIPGSTIKGALRTAVLYTMIKDNKASYADFWPEIKRALEAGDNKRLLNSIKQLEGKAFQTLKYKTDSSRQGAVNDVFKGIMVGDSQPIKPLNLAVMGKRDLSTYSKNKDHIKKLPIYREYLKPRTQTEFLLTIDKTLVNNSYLQEFNNLNQALLSMTHDLIEEETGLYEIFVDIDNNFRFPNEVSDGEPYPNICLAGGAGFFTKTVTLALAPSQKEAIESIKKYMEKKFHFHKHQKLDKQISPRTLKLARFGVENHIVGWAEIKVLKEVK